MLCVEGERILIYGFEVHLMTLSQVFEYMSSFFYEPLDLPAGTA